MNGDFPWQNVSSPEGTTNKKNADDWGMVHFWHRFPHTFHQLHPGTSDSTWIAAGLDLAGREPATFNDV